MKKIHVVAAVICDSLSKKSKILATARGYGDFKGKWEFPGGKIEIGEKPQEALIREIREELDELITIGKYIDTIEYDYPEFHLTMECYWAEIRNGDLVLLEHESAKWLNSTELYSVEWLPADLLLIDRIEQEMNGE